jgi:hypothetical protein
MSPKFKAPTLAEITYEYLGLHRQPARQSDYDRLIERFIRTLHRIQDPAEIRAALALDTHQYLPVQMKSPAYERLIALEGRHLKLLREYSQILYEFGPEFAPYADQLWDEADELEEQQEG